MGFSSDEEEGTPGGSSEEPRVVPLLPLRVCGALPSGESRRSFSINTGNLKSARVGIGRQ